MGHLPLRCLLIPHAPVSLAVAAHVAFRNQARRESALAGLASVQAGQKVANSDVEPVRLQQEEALEAARAQDLAARKASWCKTRPDSYTLPVWYLEKAEMIKAAEAQWNRCARLDAK